MKERSSLRDTFFSLKRQPQRRPVSVATEFVDTDFDEEDILTDFEEPGDNSPRVSLRSVSVAFLSLKLPPERTGTANLGFVDWGAQYNDTLFLR